MPLRCWKDVYTVFCSITVSMFLCFKNKNCFHLLTDLITIVRFIHYPQRLCEQAVSKLSALYSSRKYGCVTCLRVATQTVSSCSESVLNLLDILQNFTHWWTVSGLSIIASIVFLTANIKDILQLDSMLTPNNFVVKYFIIGATVLNVLCLHHCCFSACP